MACSSVPPERNILPVMARNPDILSQVLGSGEPRSVRKTREAFECVVQSSPLLMDDNPAGPLAPDRLTMWERRGGGGAELCRVATLP